MTKLGRSRLLRVVLNMMLICLLLYIAYTNSLNYEGGNISVIHLLLYNVLLLLPAWINNFYLLPVLDRSGKFGRYFLLVFLVCSLCSVVLSAYLRGLLLHYPAADPIHFTPVALLFSAPEPLKFLEPFYHAAPGVFLMMTLYAVAYFIQRVFTSHIRKQEIEQERTVAELSLLKSQVSPHFLFNVMNSIYSLSLSKSDKTPEVILQLSDILRYLLYETRTDAVPLMNEIRVLEQYIEIEKVRVPPLTEILFEYPPIADHLSIAPMLLLPLVENAFKHGVDSTVDRSYIHLYLTEENNVLTFRCINNYKERKAKDNAGIGIENIRKRLALLYPAKHRFSIDQSQDRHEVTLSLNLK